ncbi:MAG: hypothetical protein MZU97_26500 [Bacillus subtilis]|nr:hypothetical protein [Bacillus subtilis]
MKRLDRSELIFRILSYVAHHLVRALDALPVLVLDLDGRSPANRRSPKVASSYGPIDVQFDAVMALIIGERAEELLDRVHEHLVLHLLRHRVLDASCRSSPPTRCPRRSCSASAQIGFLIVFTMWFSRRLDPDLHQLPRTLGQQPLGHHLRLRRPSLQHLAACATTFNGISKEIEEAAIVDGANEFQVLTKIYLPMSKSALATVTLFYALNRWNGYFWNMRLVQGTEHPLQVILQRHHRKRAELRYRDQLSVFGVLARLRGDHPVNNSDHRRLPVLAEILRPGRERRRS